MDLKSLIMSIATVVLLVAAIFIIPAVAIVLLVAVLFYIFRGVNSD